MPAEFSSGIFKIGGIMQSKNAFDENAWKMLEQAIENQQEVLVKLIQDLIRRPSDKTEKGAQLFLRDWLKDFDIDCEIWDINPGKLSTHRAWVETGLDYKDRPNLVTVHRGTGEGKSISLLGHIDVVPFEEPEKWVGGDPWSGIIQDGKIFGRGSLDMKSGLAIGAFLVALIKKTGIQLRGDIILQSVIDEENGGNGTLAAIEKGYRADASIFLEPSGEEFMGISGRGAQFFRITIPGQAGGIEYQYDLSSAISKAVYLYKAVERYSDMLNSKADHPYYAYDQTKVPCAICKIQSGNWPSTLPAECVMEGSIECLPGVDIEDRKKDFQQYIFQVAEQDEWLREHPPVFEWFGLRYESAEIPIDSPIIDCVRRASQTVLSKDVLPVGGGGSDLRLPVLYADSPCILYGPKGGAIHSTNEYVLVESIINVTKVVGRSILEWCA